MRKSKRLGNPQTNNSKGRSLRQKPHKFARA
jgi:hypothetical protein